MTVTDLWVDRTDFRNTCIVEASQPELGEGEIRVAIDKFAITSNNVGYAVSGVMLDNKISGQQGIMVSLRE